MSKLKVGDRVRWVDYAPTNEVGVLKKLDGNTAYVLFDGKKKVEPMSVTALDPEVIK